MTIVYKKTLEKKICDMRVTKLYSYRFIKILELCKQDLI